MNAVASATPEIATEANVDDLLTGALPVLIDFWADWCGPCRALAPAVDEIAEDYAGRLRVAKLDVVANPAAAERFAARSLPTLVLFKDGAEAGRAVGALSKTRLAAFVEDHI